MFNNVMAEARYLAAAKALDENFESELSRFFKAMDENVPQFVADKLAATFVEAYLEKLWSEARK